MHIVLIVNSKTYASVVHGTVARKKSGLGFWNSWPLLTLTRRSSPTFNLYPAGISYCADLSSWRTCCQRIRLPVHCLPRGFWIWRRHCLL